MTPGILKLAILAVGGQGGGVLTEWIVALAERCGYAVQSSYVAGVAQRTGATIYYVEMAPRSEGRSPVFALAPAPGDVDILIAAELAEAGRAIQRGFVTPDRTVLIASTHRLLAVSEKIVPGDGRAEAERVIEVATRAATRFVGFDMQRIAEAAGTVVSAALFGALAGAGVLPFARARFEEVVHAGRGAEANLRAFAVAYDTASGRVAPVAAPQPTRAAALVVGPEGLAREYARLEARVAALPDPVAALARPGLAKVVDFQDLTYGTEYLDRLDRALAQDAAPWAFGAAAAKHLANAMAYDDVIRVADLKTRGTRADRVRGEVRLAEGQRLMTTEYFHPRVEEVCGILPARLGTAILARPRLVRTLRRAIDRGRRVRTDRMLGFGLLWLIGGLRRMRRRSLRHQGEMAHLDRWFALALSIHARSPALGTEVLACRRLVKGYSDTHARGLSKFDRVIGMVPRLVERPDGADWLRRLRQAALADERGEALEGAIRTVESFATAEG